MKVIRDLKFVAPIIYSLPFNDSRIAKRSFQLLHDVMKVLKISTSDPEEPYANPVQLKSINSSYFRACKYAFFTKWYRLNKDYLDDSSEAEVVVEMKK